MASIIEELIATLDGELVLYEKLIPLAEQKSVAVIENNLDSLAVITDSEQRILDDLILLENKRDKSVSNIKDVLGKRNENMNLDKIIRLLDRQPIERDRLIKVHDALKNVADRLQQVNMHNKSLIEESLEMIEFSMNFIQSTRMSPGSNNYNKEASFMDASSSRTGMFDTKQ